ncbi:MAG: hypothetical protein HYY33_00940 [Chloroflexi bacterium]|nr:hypothetical protein [Chloroflexota bacterium]
MTDPRDQYRCESADKLFQLGRAALREGDRAGAKRLLMQAVEYNRDHADAWLWLSATTDDPAEQKGYLEWAVAADPGNPAARRGLAILDGKLKPEEVLPEGAEVAHGAPAEPEEAQSRQAFECPRCGGEMQFGTAISDLKCARCGYVQAVDDVKVKDSDRLLDLTLATRMGHVWAEAQRRYACGQCGAATIFPAGQTSIECPFCGSLSLIAAPEDAGLVSPDSIVLMGVDAGQARKIMLRWLGSGFFTPDDLKKLAHGKGMRPAYVPFWVFEATLNGKWRAEAAVESGRYTRWEPRTGEHILFYSNQLRLAAKALPADLAKQAEPFDLSKLVEYKPEYLAGWPAVTYDISLADASLAARETMLADAKRQLGYKAAPGQEVRNLEMWGDFGGVAYRLALLPLWVGAYHYQGRQYRVLVNGQTQEVVGDKPVDALKIVLAAVGVAATLLLVAALALALWPR